MRLFDDDLGDSPFGWPDSSDFLLQSPRKVPCACLGRHSCHAEHICIAGFDIYILCFALLLSYTVFNYCLLSARCNFPKLFWPYFVTRYTRYNY